MKKILLTIMFVLLLTGCSEVDNPDYYIDDWEREDRLEFIDGLRDCYDVNFDDEDCMVQDVRFYTQEEVDLMLQEIYDGFEDIESNDGYIEETYVSHMELDLYLHFERNNLLDIINELERELENNWTIFDDYEDAVANKIIELEARIEELTPIDDTLSLSSEHYTVNITLENGYITLFEVCGNGVCENGTADTTQRFLNFEKQIVLDDMQRLLDTLEELHELF